MPRLTLVSHDLCPYVQRAAIALAEKGVAYEQAYIDLANKPDWFKAISPLGKVPLLRVDDDIIFESAVILEYLDETLPNPLLPRDALMRAKHRAMVEFGSAILADIWGIETAPTRVVLDAKVATLRDKFVRLEAMLGQGTWFGGDAFGVVDAAFGPVFRYFDLFDVVFDHGAMTGLPKVAHWRAALAARPSVQNAVLPDYRDRLQDFVRTQNGALAELIIGHTTQAPAA